MTYQDKVYTAAEEYVTPLREATKWSDISDKRVDSIRDAFVEGANWFRKAVWHNATEKPLDFELVLMCDLGDMSFICGPYIASKDAVSIGDEYYYKLTGEWAYIRDIYEKFNRNE